MSMKYASFLRWTARSLSVGLAALFAAIAVGEGPAPLLHLSWSTPSFCLLLLSLVGLLVAWRKEAFGATLAISGSVGFYVYDFVSSGFERFPGGWVFPLLILTPVLYLIAWTAQRTARVGFS